MPLAFTEPGRHDGNSRSTDENRYGSGGISVYGYYSAHDSHNPVEGDADTVTGGSVSRGQDFGRIGIETAVVDVETEGDGAVEAEVLGTGADTGVSEEEYHCWVEYVSNLKGKSKIEGGHPLVTIAPDAIVPFRPRKLHSHIKPASTGPQTLHMLTIA